MLAHKGVPTLQYLAKTEAHTFAFSVAANAILSFFPFMVVMLWLVRNVFHSQGMEDVVTALLRDHLPAGQDLVINNLKAELSIGANDTPQRAVLAAVYDLPFGRQRWMGGNMNRFLDALPPGTNKLQIREDDRTPPPGPRRNGGMETVEVRP